MGDVDDATREVAAEDEDADDDNGEDVAEDGEPTERSPAAAKSGSSFTMTQRKLKRRSPIRAPAAVGQPIEFRGAR